MIFYQKENEAFLAQNAVEQRLQEINESWGADMSPEEAQATQQEYDELYRQLHPEWFPTE